MTATRTIVMNSKQVSQRLNRLAWQVYEHCSEEREIVVAGIAPNGYNLAKRISALIEKNSPIKVSLVEMKMNKDQPRESLQVAADPKQLEGKTIILVDDVSNSGRTLLYGVKYFLEFPVRAIYTLVLVDRDHARFPVKANFVGLSLATTLQEHITVELSENGDSVFLD
jgi:pyrimidine operon attenuation protein / uracil phosphoribosyltransferase